MSLEKKECTLDFATACFVATGMLLTPTEPTGTDADA